ncbi:hypothetical protein A2U01_0077555, partial [Trifolium medium]|nr:hypothetical protein [Trifolium medium]
MLVKVRIWSLEFVPLKVSDLSPSDITSYV